MENPKADTKVEEQTIRVEEAQNEEIPIPLDNHDAPDT